MNILLVGNDQVIELLGARDAVTGDYLNSKTVTCTVKDSDGVNVSGETWPITLSYIAASNGDYRGTLEDGLALEDGNTYIVEVHIDAGSDLIGFWRFEVVAQYRDP